RRRHTRFSRDWSSDVCSSDLAARMAGMDPELEAFVPLLPQLDPRDPAAARRTFAELATSIPATDASDLEIEDLDVPADPAVPVQIGRASCRESMPRSGAAVSR